MLPIFDRAKEVENKVAEQKRTISAHSELDLRESEHRDLTLGEERSSDGDRGIDCKPNEDIRCETTDCEDSGCEDSGSEDSGSEDSGCEDSGSEDSGCEDSGCEDSGCEDSGCEDSGVEDIVGEDEVVEGGMGINPSSMTDKELMDRVDALSKKLYFSRNHFIACLPEIAKRRLWDNGTFTSVGHFAKVKACLKEKTIERVFRLYNKIKYFPSILKLFQEVTVGWSKIEIVRSVLTKRNARHFAKRLLDNNSSTLRRLVKKIRKDNANNGDNSKNADNAKSGGFGTNGTNDDFAENGSKEAALINPAAHAAKEQGTFGFSLFDSQAVETDSQSLGDDGSGNTNNFSGSTNNFSGCANTCANTCANNGANNGGNNGANNGGNNGANNGANNGGNTCSNSGGKTGSNTGENSAFECDVDSPCEACGHIKGNSTRPGGGRRLVPMNVTPVVRDMYESLLHKWKRKDKKIMMNDVAERVMLAALEMGIDLTFDSETGPAEYPYGNDNSTEKENDAQRGGDEESANSKNCEHGANRENGKNGENGENGENRKNCENGKNCENNAVKSGSKKKKAKPARLDRVFWKRPYVQLINCDVKTGACYTKTYSGWQRVCEQELVSREALPESPIDLKQLRLEAKEYAAEYMRKHKLEGKELTDHIPEFIKFFILLRSQGFCEFPGCNRRGRKFHHLKRQCLDPDCDPDGIVFDCDECDSLFHDGVVENEFGPFDNFKISVNYVPTTEGEKMRAKIDAKVQSIKREYAEDPHTYPTPQQRSRKMRYIGDDSN